MGNVKLNIGGGGGVTETLPTVLASCSALAYNRSAQISWEYTNTDYVKGMRICYKTDGYPENAEDGNCTDIEGCETTTAAITGLSNNVRWYFRLFAYNENGDFQASITNATCSCVPTANSIIVEAGTAVLQTGVTDDGLTGWAIITSSGTVKITSDGEQPLTAYLVGGGAKGGNSTYSSSSSTTYNYSGGKGGQGGYVNKVIVPAAVGTEEMVATIAAAAATSGTSLSFNGDTYECSNGEFREGGARGYYTSSNGTISSKNAEAGSDGWDIIGYGYVGSSGGGGGARVMKGAGGGIGAGDGKDSGNGGAATQYGCGGGGAGVYSTGYTGGVGFKGVIILNWDIYPEEAV